MPSESCLQRPPSDLQAAVGEFNRQAFFKCHETLEALWMGEPGPIRQLYKGILQLGVAFYHLQAGRARSAAFLLERASNYLQPFAPHCMGLDLEHLLTRVSYCLEQVRQYATGHLDQFDWGCIPQIQMTT